MFFEDNIDDAKYCGHLYGLGTSYVNGGQAYSGPSSNSNTNSSWYLHVLLLSEALDMDIVNLDFNRHPNIPSLEES